jgi:hypothetical protein
MLDDRFWTKVRTAGPQDCWEWQANKNNKGYGLFRPGGLAPKVLAHRASYEAANGPIQRGLLILHSCDNRACVNPAHLRVGTHKQNVADMDQRGRRVTKPMRGEDNPNTAATAELVTSVRKAYVSGMSIADITAKFKVSEAAANDYCTGKSWRHILGVNGCPTKEELAERAKINTKSNAKITHEIADEIRRRLSCGETGRALAAEYAIHYATVSDIKHRKIWA